MIISSYRDEQLKPWKQKFNRKYLCYSITIIAVLLIVIATTISELVYMCSISVVWCNVVLCSVV